MSYMPSSQEEVQTPTELVEYVITPSEADFAVAYRDQIVKADLDFESSDPNVSAEARKVLNLIRLEATEEGLAIDGFVRALRFAKTIGDGRDQYVINAGMAYDRPKQVGLDMMQKGHAKTFAEALEKIVEVIHS